MRAGLQMVVDGVDGEQVRAVLEAEMASATERHHASAKFFHAMAGYAPIFGLMGTILGIIGVMGHLSEPSELGHGIALALLGVLYGVVFGNLIYLPIANKLDRLHELEMQVRELVLEGVLAVREGVSARLLIERLEARLAPSERVGHATRMGRGEEAA
jgi:chemotaxis protein MotA